MGATYNYTFTFKDGSKRKYLSYHEITNDLHITTPKLSEAMKLKKKRVYVPRLKQIVFISREKRDSNRPILVMNGEESMISTIPKIAKQLGFSKSHIYYLINTGNVSKGGYTFDYV